MSIFFTAIHGGKMQFTNKPNVKLAYTGKMDGMDRS